MPFTPLHMGPGMAVKAAMPRHFSIIVFGLAQIACDLEVLWYLVRWEPPLHRFWHTYLGATVIAVALAILGKPLSQWIKSLWNWVVARSGLLKMSVAVSTSWLASFLGASLGAYSHVVLDSLFHPDLEPAEPWSAINPLRGTVSRYGLDVVCVLAGIAGLAWFIAREKRH